VRTAQPQGQHGKGKSDPIDAHLAVLAALRLDADRLPVPRADGDREALRIRLGARHELTVANTAQTNRLRATAGRRRHRARYGSGDAHRSRTRSRRAARESREASREQAVRHGEIRRLASAVRAGRHALAANRAQLQTIVDEMAPGLTQRRGIGAVTAAHAIVSFSHPGRCRRDAAFAALSGTSRLQASSGKTVRHRLNRAGDRALNRAIHTIAMTRMRCCPDDHELRRSPHSRAQSSRIRRCLRRYIARELPHPQRQHHAHHSDVGGSSGRLTNIEAS
jgi:transposase